MSAPNPSPADERLDEGEAMPHPFYNPTPEHEEEVDHHHGPEEAVRSLLAAASRLAGGDAPFSSGRNSERLYPVAREGELNRLRSETLAPLPTVPFFADGGEHRVFGSSEDRIIIKHTLPGFYGRILDEKSLLDPRTFLHRKQLAMRGALPSEYLLRWAVMADVFGLATRYLGRTEGKDEPCMAVSQPFIVELPEDPATLDDVAALMEAHGFSCVDPAIIVNPEIKDVTWYRQRDGLLITDAHARNFRKDTEGLIFPIDLVITVVAPGAFTTLPQADAIWRPSYQR
jgi:hypothetical protein